MAEKDTFSITVEVPKKLECVKDTLRYQLDSVVSSIEAAYNIGIIEGEMVEFRKYLERE